MQESKTGLWPYPNPDSAEFSPGLTEWESDPWHYFNPQGAEFMPSLQQSDPDLMLCIHEQLASGSCPCKETGGWTKAASSSSKTSVGTDGSSSEEEFEEFGAPAPECALST